MNSIVAKAVASFLLTVTAGTLVLSSATAQSLNDGQPVKLKLADLSRRQARRAPAPQSCEETLLVMPNPKADTDEGFEALKEAHGTIIGTIGQGELTCLIIKTEKGKLAETEKKLSADNHFNAVQRNFFASSRVQSTTTVNDPYFASQWHLGALNVPQAWSKSTGQGVVVAIGDSGSQASNPDLAGKTYPGVDVVRQTGNGNVDYHTNGSHGTDVATTACASTNNRSLTASPAYGSYVFPIRLSESDGNNGMVTSDSLVASAIYAAGSQGIRILNISYGGHAPGGFSNAKAHPVVHQYLKWYHDQRNGMAFFAAGNFKEFDSNPRLPYLIMVSALNKSYSLADFSNYGNPVWFTAPGVNIVCSDRNSRVVSVDGTSFASPLVASVAAMVLARNSRLSNLQVENILIKSCSSRNAQWNQQFGFGLPDANAAVTLAQ